MRGLGILLSLLPGLSLANGGVYKSSSGEETPWSVNANHTLLWNGAPYLPYGLRIGASATEIEAAKAAGFRDVVVDCPLAPGVMKAAVESLEKAGLRYILCISALAPTAHGVLVEPQGNRFTGITAKTTLHFRIPGAEEALVVLALRRDGSIQNTQRVQGQNGAFTVEVTPPNDLEHVALIYPITSSLAQLGAWESFDSHRDGLLTDLKGAGLGKGLRGILNPMGTFAPAAGRRSFVPTGRLFRFEFEAYLRQTYRNPETVMRSWAMSAADQTEFAEFARLIPLWNASRGVSMLWDADKNKLYSCEMKRSTIWRDLDAVISAAETRRAERLIASIRKVADVPVLQEWSGWSPLYEGNSHGFDGIAARTSGASPSELAETAARAASTVLRWPGPGWFLATQIDLSGVPEAPTQVAPVLDDLASLGVRGGFVQTQEAAVRTAAVQAAVKGQDSTLADWSPKPLFYPESAHNPASSMRLPGGTWWLPAPGAGNRIDFGTLFEGYRIESPTPSIALWSRQGQIRMKLDMINPKNGLYQSLDGTKPDPRIGKGSVEVNLSEIPLIVSGIEEIPVPEHSYNELVFRFGALLEEANRRLVDSTEEQYLFRDYLNGYDRNPGGNFFLMQGVMQKLASKLARYLWIEAENPRESNFSEILAEPGDSHGNALSLRTQLSSEAAEYTAEYQVQSRTEDEVECWLAARINRSDRDKVKVLLGGQELSIAGEPVSGYGNGYAWYPMGKTRMGKTPTKIVLRVKAPEGADLAVDVLLFYPGTFHPRGVAMPDAIAFPSVVPTKGRKIGNKVQLPPPSR